MLEGSCLMTRDLPASCEQESQCIYKARVVERSSKRRLEDAEDVASRKAARPLDAEERQEKMEGLKALPSLQTDQSDNQHQAAGLSSISFVQTDQPDNQHQAEGLSVLSAVQSDQPDQHPAASHCGLSVMQTDLPDNRHQAGVLSVHQYQAAGLCGLSVMQTDQPDNEHLAVGLSGLSMMQTVQRDNEHEAAGLTGLSVVQSDLPVNQHQATGLIGVSLMQIDQPDNQHHVAGVQVFPAMQANQPSNQDQVDDNLDSSSLIDQLGREVSISCLVHCSRSDYGTIASLNKSFLSVVRSDLLYKLRRQKGIIEHWVYFSCNLLEWEAFDPIRHRWMHLPRMNSNECFMCSDKESLAVGTELLVFGKEIESHVIYRYSILTNMWTSGMKINMPRCLFGSASLGEIAILAGGCDPNGNVLHSAELYNSDTGMWITIPSMNKARKMCSGVFMDGKFYVIGGIGTGNTKMLTCGEVYDLEKKTWRVIPDMFPARNGGMGGNETSAAAEAPPLVAVVNNELYAADYAQKEVRKYDKKKNVWITLGGLPEQAVSINGWGLAFRACGDQLIVIGGPRALGGGMIELNSWVPSEGPPQWDLLAKKPSGSFVYNCAVMGC